MGGRRVLVVCFDPLDEAMAGPAIRAWHLAEELAAAGHEVTLASTARATRSHPAFAVTHLDGQALDAAAYGVDAVFAPVSVARRHPNLVKSGVPLAIDLYIPTHLENLEPAGRDRDRHAADVAHQVAVIGEDLAGGDFFVCASERQRDFWLGALASAGRVNPATTAGDPGLRSLVDVVPFGLPSEPPAPQPGIMRARFGIPATDTVLLWGGGVYEWLDPAVVVRAVARLRDEVPAVHLVFLGLRNPNPEIPDMPVVAALRAEAEALGLAGTRVHFNEDWVPYEERGSWLLDADLAVSTHADHLETRFSFRTRVLDYLWARRPMILTGGDELSDRVESAGLGVAVDPGDDAAIAAAVLALQAVPPDPAAWEPVVASYRWDAVAAPLRSWVASPRVAADRREARRAERSAVIEPGGIQAALDGLVTGTLVDGDAPVRSRRPEAQVAKRGVKLATRWYFRFVADQASTVGQTFVQLGTALADRVERLDARQRALEDRAERAAARLAALEGSTDTDESAGPPS